MSLFSEELKLREIKQRSVDIDENFYNLLGELARKYKTSITKLVVIAVEELLKTKKVVVYQRETTMSTISRTYRFQAKILKGLENLKSEYGDLAVYRLINIAIRNALIREGLIK